VIGRRGVPILGLTLALFQGQLAAQPSGTVEDFLHVNVQADSMSAASDGGGGGLEWQRPLSARAGLDLGVLSYSLAGSRWTYGKVIAHAKLHDRMTIYGEVDRGAGRRTGEGFTYQVYRAGLISTLISGKLFLDLEEQYLHVDETEGNIVKTGVVVSPVPSLRTSVSYYFSTAGDATSRFLSGRLDARWKRIDYLTGFTTGRASPEQFNIITGTDEAARSKEFFAGAAIPAGRQVVTLVLDTLRISGETKYTLSLSWKLPLHPVRRLPPTGPAPGKR
jgi:hypothetical protein